MQLYIVRHGETEENLQRILQGHMQGHLTDKGKEQVRGAAEQLAAMDIPFKCVVSSDLQRAVDSAHIIARRMHLSVVLMEELRERDWRKFTGMTFTEAKALYHSNGHWAFPEGSVESEEEMLIRADRVLQLLQQQYLDEAVIVVTHGQLARLLFAVYLGISCAEVPHFSNAEIRVLTI